MIFYKHFPVAPGTIIVGVRGAFFRGVEWKMKFSHDFREELPRRFFPDIPPLNSWRASTFPVPAGAVELRLKMEGDEDDVDWDVKRAPDADMAYFRECASCAAKPGAALLCDSCLYNRTLIERLQSKSRSVRFSERLHFEEAVIEPDGRMKVELLGGHQTRLTFVISKKDRDRFLALAEKGFDLLLTDKGPVTDEHGVKT